MSGALRFESAACSRALRVALAFAIVLSCIAASPSADARCRKKLRRHFTFPSQSLAGRRGDCAVPCKPYATECRCAIDVFNFGFYTLYRYNWHDHISGSSGSSKCNCGIINDVTHNIGSGPLQDCQAEQCSVVSTYGKKTQYLGGCVWRLPCLMGSDFHHATSSPFCDASGPLLFPGTKPDTDQCEPIEFVFVNPNTGSNILVRAFKVNAAGCNSVGAGAEFADPTPNDNVAPEAIETIPGQPYLLVLKHERVVYTVICRH
jgi:hypothetical protein